MATTDTRSGFRLPWSSDRHHDAPAPEPAADGAPEEAVAEPTGDAPAWPSNDLNARLGLSSQPRAADLPDETRPPEASEEPEMTYATTESVAPAAPRKPSKLMADLSAAIRATAEAARGQALSQVDADVASVIDQIRAGAKDGESALRARSDADVAQIKEWSRSEIARIKEQTEQRISARKQTLDGELAAHAAAIQERVGEVERSAAMYRANMEAYAERLGEEDDPARLATMAESIPEPPSLQVLADLADLEPELPAAALETEPEAVLAEPLVAEAVLAEPLVAEAVLAEPLVAEAAVEVVLAEPEPEVEPMLAEPEAMPAEPEAIVAEPEPEVEVEPEPEAIFAEPETEPDPEPEVPTTTGWNDTSSAWGAAPPAEADEAVDATAIATATAEYAASLHDDGSGEWTAGGDVPRWAAGEVPEGFPTGDGEAGDPVDRGAIMAALEAAAEAVVAAESAAESADQAEAAADVAETAAELIKQGRAQVEEELDPEAAAALSARVGAGGFEESYTDRLASLLPGHADPIGDGQPRTTQVIVAGLISVASIASFKRHLARLAGVQAVTVASGPDGEFVFNVTHRADVSFRDAVPTMPGFAARVTGISDGIVHVTARDPEAEG